MIALAAALLLATPVAARDALETQVRALLAQAPPGMRFGLVVADEAERELVAVEPDMRFVPASNTKILTTIAAFDRLAALDAQASGAGVRLERNDGATDVVLVGHGDARLSSAPDCAVNCLATLADAVAAGTRSVRHVVGDDSRFPDQRWSAGMSWNNMPTGSGTAVSALTLDDNEVALRVTPGTPGRPPAVAHDGYFEIDNRALTVAGGRTDLEADRDPGGRVLRLSGAIAADAAPQVFGVGLDDPAHRAAWRLAAMLRERGVRVTGEVQARHRPPRPFDDPERRAGPPPRPPTQPLLAQLAPPPTADDLAVINKASQNVHAELLLRRLGGLEGSGSAPDGVAAVAATLAKAGVPREGWDVADGSGMSSYNRVGPRAMVKLLRWAAQQPWGPAFRATLPVAGVDGTLRRRFRSTALQGRLFAKTGTLYAANALAGYFTAADGRTLTFAAYANDAPGGASATRWIDGALLLIAAAP